MCVRRLLLFYYGVQPGREARARSVARLDRPIDWHHEHSVVIVVHLVVSAPNRHQSPPLPPLRHSLSLSLSLSLSSTGRATSSSRYLDGYHSYLDAPCLYLHLSLFRCSPLLFYHLPTRPPTHPLVRRNLLVVCASMMMMRYMLHVVSPLLITHPPLASLPSSIASASLLSCHHIEQQQ